MLDSFSHPENVRSAIDVILLLNPTCVRAEHAQNAAFPTLNTLSGIVIFSRFLHPRNASSPMDTMLSGIVILVSDVQDSKA